MTKRSEFTEIALAVAKILDGIDDEMTKDPIIPLGMEERDRHDDLG